jgi:hypothetical protein
MQATLDFALRALALGAVVALLSNCTAQTPGALEPMESTQVQALGGGDLLGCPYPSGDVWQENIRSAKIAPKSAAEIKATIDAGGGGYFRVDAPVTDEYINPATDQTPLVPVKPKERDHTPYSPWPWEPNFYIEPSSDGHAMVLQGQDCHFYEGGQVSYSGGTLSMDTGCLWNLTKPFKRPEQGACSEESGIPLGLVAVRPEELSAGVIQHAIGWDTVSYTLSQTACVSPAGKTDCTGDLPYHGPGSEEQDAMPFGAHIRLRSSFNDSNFPREAKIVAEALKSYGAYAFTAGCCNTFPFVDDINGAPTWTYADESAIQGITLSNFDVVVPPR